MADQGGYKSIRGSTRTEALRGPPAAPRGGPYLDIHLDTPYLDKSSLSRKECLDNYLDKTDKMSRSSLYNNNKAWRIRNNLWH